MVATSPWAAPPATTIATATGRPQPTYTKMLTQALAELEGTCGRAAIAGFIFGHFTGLPASHDALLSAHLRRLVTEGVVRSYRRCYVFPASNTRGRGRPRNDANPLPKNLLDLNLDDYSDDDATPLRNSGCGYVLSDSQPQQNSDPNLNGFQSNSSGEDHVDEYTPRRVLGANSSRGHGRPRKVNLSANGDASSVTKRGRGRPRKLQKYGPSPSPGGDPSTGIKRGHGRPRKEEQQSEAKHPPMPTASTGGIKRGQQSEAAAEPPPTPLSTGGLKRGRGRPTKEQQLEAAKLHLRQGGSR